MCLCTVMMTCGGTRLGWGWMGKGNFVKNTLFFLLAFVHKRITHISEVIFWFSHTTKLYVVQLHNIPTIIHGNNPHTRHPTNTMGYIPTANQREVYTTHTSLSQLGRKNNSISMISDLIYPYRLIDTFIQKLTSTSKLPTIEQLSVVYA